MIRTPLYYPRAFEPQGKKFLMHTSDYKEMGADNREKAEGREDAPGLGSLIALSEATRALVFS